MGHGNKHKKIHAAGHLPAVVRAKKAEDAALEIAIKYGHMRRLLLCVVKQSGGRVEIDEKAYREALQAPDLETLIKTTEVDPVTKKIGIIHINKDGEPIDDPGASRIITPD